MHIKWYTHTHEMTRFLITLILDLFYFLPLTSQVLGCYTMTPGATPSTTPGRRAAASWNISHRRRPETYCETCRYFPSLSRFPSPSSSLPCSNPLLFFLVAFISCNFSTNGYCEGLRNLTQVHKCTRRGWWLILQMHHTLHAKYKLELNFRSAQYMCIAFQDHAHNRHHTYIQPLYHNSTTTNCRGLEVH